MRVVEVTTNNEVKIVELPASFGTFTKQNPDGTPAIIHAPGLPPPYFMWANEYTFSQEMPVNYLGCLLYGTAVHGISIQGNFFVIKDVRPEFGGTMTDMTQEEAESIAASLNATLADLRRSINF